MNNMEAGRSGNHCWGPLQSNIALQTVLSLVNWGWLPTHRQDTYSWRWHCW